MARPPKIERGRTIHWLRTRKDPLPFSAIAKLFGVTKGAIILSYQNWLRDLGKVIEQ